MPGSIFHTINGDSTITICFLCLIIALVIIPDMECNALHDSTIAFADFLQDNGIFQVLYRYIYGCVAVIQRHIMLRCVQNISGRSCCLLYNVVSKFQFFAGGCTIGIRCNSINNRAGYHQCRSSNGLNICGRFDVEYGTGKFFVIFIGLCDRNLAGFSCVGYIQR